MNERNLSSKKLPREPKIPEDFDPGIDEGSQKPNQEVLPPISQTLFPHSEVTKTFNNLADDPSAYSENGALQLAAASMRENDKRQDEFRRKIENHEKTIETLRSSLENLRVDTARKASEIKGLRAMRWITSIVYTLGALTLSAGWNEFEKNGAIFWLIVGCALLVIGFVSPLFLKNVGDEE